MKRGIWKDIIGYEGLYRISRFGRAKSLEKIIDKGRWGKVVFPKKTLIPIKDRYLFVNLYKNKKPTKTSIHVLVAKHFIPNPHNKPEVNHKDGDKYNPHWKNLEWTTHKENSEHASKNNLVARNFGQNNGAHKLTKEDVSVIRNSRYIMSRKELSEMFGVSIKHIDRVRCGERWGHIK
jgi:hypothetical protein